MLKKIWLYPVILTGCIFAGVNDKAVFRIDMIPSTVAVDSMVIDTQLNRNFEVAVWVDSVKDLKSFSVRLKIVGDKYTYVSCSKDGHSRKNILDGGMFFDDNQSDKIEFIGSLQDSASSKTSGLLGMFVFTSKLNWNESVAIEFFDATLYALNGDEDAFTSPSAHLISGTYKVEQQTNVVCNNTPQSRNDRFFARHDNGSGAGSRVCFFYTRGCAANGLIGIYTMNGKRIYEMFFTLPQLSNHTSPALIAQWDLSSNNGNSVAPGTYLAFLSVKENASSAKRYAIKIDITRH